MIIPAFANFTRSFSHEFAFCGTCLLCQSRSAQRTDASIYTNRIAGMPMQIRKALKRGPKKRRSA
jgi:hypothetical protein